MKWATTIKSMDETLAGGVIGCQGLVHDWRIQVEFTWTGVHRSGRQRATLRHSGRNKDSTAHWGAKPRRVASV